MFSELTNNVFCLVLEKISRQETMAMTSPQKGAPSCQIGKPVSSVQVYSHFTQNNTCQSCTSELSHSKTVTCVFLFICYNNKGIK